ncbi:hypothetical protein ACH5RR_033530 [Cinchona calisaya]|uniref:Uncharacterized protein n=1 Tax=Cinchona calisaya TaxID=153742 RepID=A0ABD2YME8_9GENT
MRETIMSHRSFTLDHRFQPVRAVKTIQNHNNNKNNVNVINPMHPMQETSSSRKTRQLAKTSSSSTTIPSTSYAISTNGKKKDSSDFKKRIATYKAYAVESKIKASVRKSFSWMKNKYTYFVHGY